MKNANQTGYGPLESGALEATSSGSASAVSSDAAESKAAASEQHLQGKGEISSCSDNTPNESNALQSRNITTTYYQLMKSYGRLMDDFARAPKFTKVDRLR